MFKVLIIIFLIGFVFFRTIGFLMRLLTGSAATHRPRQHNPFSQPGPQQSAHQQPSNGNVHIDYVPKNEAGKDGGKFKGGEYVDFEEVE